MSGVYLFGLASRQAQHLAVRQATIAGNVANADTPGYKARDVAPFAEVLARTGLGMAATDGRHLQGSPGAAAVKVRPSETWDPLDTGRSVSLEQELLKSNEVAREHSLNTAVVKSFHRMLIASLRSGA